jgi:hypothetical protein
VVWARTAPKQKLSMCLPIGISKTKCYFQVTVHPGFPKNPSTRTFMVQEDDNKPYQEVLSAASIKSGYEQVAS